ncbi:phosphatase PAP2 family protein [Pseudomonas sp. BCA14]|uniref:phosphatase PAP2/dual specificity phosphatase family protein n=1 Tax=unclassified Pseudomonas TaxID=196821 RepID=UPI00106F08BA|nr:MULTISPECIES: phosphatase PAP2/dual specificity phosphatase family protein [unclassified Pseudomonas]TFF07177.1 phosphatase PAP2 family protein [Pseudomonas sp. JMN1]TFF10738.1 phosphatase PAP2 family protein [Pseudomonas sp. BCA17]TFF18565.1 phosphatase PAP2 family protein [Pseudomonas sp. BCA14]TFF23534.1 phosphatase PAP2 family protein [Pseudomonas sp. BCA13]
MREPGLLKPAVLWLLLLAPLFFSTYGFATWVTSQRSDVGTLVFDWETHMPFWAWTIVPYWSIDLLYGFSLLLPNSRHELKQHALRLLSAQAIAVSCFLLWPLRFTFERPELDGVFGWLFAVLAGFDKPFNQAPSLHIALLVILWVMYQRHTQGVWRWLVHGWFALIGISVLTTYQHHFIDLPTGALAGWLCVWLWPLEHPSPLRNARLTRDTQRWRIGLRYGLGTVALLILALVLGGWWLWLIWPAVSLGLIKANYLVLGAPGFQKRNDGRLTPAARWLYAPYLAGAWINSRLWTRKHPQPDLIVDNVWLGRIPTTHEQDSFKAIVDLCAELPINPQGRAYRSIPVLDLIAPTPAECRQAADAIEQLRLDGPLLVCCALGYSRSATAVAAWLLHSGRAATLDEALAIIRTARADVVLHPAHREALEGLSHAR